MKRLFFFLSIYIFACLSFYSQTIDSSIIDEIKNCLEKAHPDPFTKTSKNEFEQNIKKLKKVWHKKSEDEQYFELRKLISSIGDAHTMIVGQMQSDALPFFILPYGDNSVIIQADKRYTALVGTELIAINGHKIKNILKKLLTIISYDKEKWGLLSAHYEARLLSNLKHIGVVKKGGNVTVKYRRISDGKVKTMNVAFSKDLNIANPEFAHLAPTLFQSGYYRALSLQDVLFIQYNVCVEQPNMPMKDFALQIEKVCSNFKKIAIDLRHNSGGNSEVIVPLLEVLSRLKEENGIKLFTIIGAGTFSSGVMAAVELKKIGSILIGEDVGWNGAFGEVKSFDFANGKYKLFCSTKDFTVNPSLSNIIPDVALSQKLTDLDNQIDTALEYIKSK